MGNCRGCRARFFKVGLPVRALSDTGFLWFWACRTPTDSCTRLMRAPIWVPVWVPVWVPYRLAGLKILKTPCTTLLYPQKYHISHVMTKPTKWVSTQQRLRSDWAHAQSDQSSLSTWRNLGSLATHWVHSKDSDQTGRIPRLIWVFSGRTAILLVLTLSRLIQLLASWSELFIFLKKYKNTLKSADLLKSLTPESLTGLTQLLKQFRPLVSPIRALLGASKSLQTPYG